MDEKRDIVERLVIKAETSCMISRALQGNVEVYRGGICITIKKKSLGQVSPRDFLMLDVLPFLNEKGSSALKFRISFVLF